MFNYQYVVCPKAIIGSYIWDSSWVTSGGSKCLKITLTSSTDSNSPINIQIVENNNTGTTTITSSPSTIQVKHYRNASESVFTNLLSIINLQASTTYTMTVEIGTYVNESFTRYDEIKTEEITTLEYVDRNVTYLHEFSTELTEAFDNIQINLNKIGYIKPIIINLSTDSREGGSCDGTVLYLKNSHIEVFYHECRHLSGCMNGTLKDTHNILKIQFGPNSGSQVHCYNIAENNLSGFEYNNEGVYFSQEYYDTLYWCLVCRAISDPDSITINTINIE